MCAVVAGLAVPADNQSGPAEIFRGALCYNTLMKRPGVRIIEILTRHKERLPLLALIVGFVWDYFLFERPDEPLENILIIAHLVLAAGAIILFSIRGRETSVARIPLVLLAQFNFGALAKSLLVLYAKSGTWEGSALFFVLFGAIIVINEFSRGRFNELRAHIMTLYLFLLLYAALIVPVLLGEIGIMAFTLGCAVAALCISGFLAIVRITTPHAIAGKIRTIYTSMVAMTGVFIALYVFNIIPPVPLAMVDIGVYHRVIREDSVYKTWYEAPYWYMPWRNTAEVFHTEPFWQAYCFSSIIAPKNFSAPIYHVWERYDDVSHTWLEEARISYAISGGRTGGYRGYTVKSALTPGAWRCSVETERGVLIGRVGFTVVVGGTPMLQSTTF